MPPSFPFSPPPPPRLGFGWAIGAVVAALLLLLIARMVAGMS